jgi:hypothetical protein
LSPSYSQSPPASGATAASSSPSTPISEPTSTPSAQGVCSPLGAAFFIEGRVASHVRLSLSWLNLLSSHLRAQQLVPPFRNSGMSQIVRYQGLFISIFQSNNSFDILIAVIITRVSVACFLAIHSCAVVRAFAICI